MQKVFEKYHHKYEPYSLFERFLEYVIACFNESTAPLERPYDKEEGTACMELLNEWVLTMQDLLQSNEWYDLLGDVYMNYLSGTMKKKWTGQYFTPMNICTFMSKIVEPGEQCGELIMDNACGSGRMLLAGHVVHPGNYCCAQDLDRICCLMTVCNFIIHGVRGEVVWGDGLDPLDFRQGWKTNGMLNVIGIPTVRSIDKMESILYRNGLAMLARANEKKSEATPPKPQKQMNDGYQGSLFDDIE